jgi:pyruvate dehydrogenase E1 component alpha subunit
MDVLAVREATRFARDYVLKEGPIILEMITYRYVAHSMTDPDNTYRSREEIQEARHNRDPITNLAKSLIEQNICTQEEIKTIDAYIKDEIKNAMSHALKDPELSVDELFNDIYLHPDPNMKIRGCDNFEYAISK